MTFNEFIQKAEEQGIIINETDIFTWFNKYATQEVANHHIENWTVPDNLEPKEVEKAGQQLMAY